MFELIRVHEIMRYSKHSLLKPNHQHLAIFVGYRRETNSNNIKFTVFEKCCKATSLYVKKNFSADKKIGPQGDQTCFHRF